MINLRGKLGENDEVERVVTALFEMLPSCAPIMCTVLTFIGLPCLPLIVLLGKRYVSPHRWESGESIIAVIPAQICPHRETTPGINKSEPPAKIYGCRGNKTEAPTVC